MIQRIQTLYFLLTALSFGAVFFLPLAFSQTTTIPVFADQFFQVEEQPILLIQAIAGAVVAMAAILLFNNRPLQIRLGYLLILQAIALPIVAFVVLSGMTSTMGTSVVVQYKPGLFVPVAAVLFSILAIISIRKDEHLVKSMDRLR